jgi:formamidopyrimidine-DNA glycosylase
LHRQKAIMPELPEVETVVRDLRPYLIGRRIERIVTSRKRLRNGRRSNLARSLVGQSIRAVRRRGKWIIVDLDRGHLLIHLGMTGQLTAGLKARAIEAHTHLFADLDDGTQLRFRDIRRFGSATYHSLTADLDRFLAERLGPEPFELRLSEFRAALGSTSRCLKAVLLDQSVVAGVGNIYADESLFRARLSPRQRGRDTSPAEADRLRRAVVRVLNFAIERRGSSIRDYVGGSGLSGSYQHEFSVYGRDGDGCRRCQTIIEVTRLAGRSTHFCPKCQASQVAIG